MGLLDKLKGHKKDNSVKDIDDVNEKNSSKRSPSLGRKSADRQRAANAQSIPEVPSHTTGTTTAATTGVTTGALGSSEPVATYPVEGNTTVGSSHGHTETSNLGADRASRPQAPDNASTAAIKDGRIGETDMDGLNRDLQRTTLSSNNGEVSHSYQPFSYDTKNLSQTPFDREAFHKSLGNGVGTTTYESIAKPAVVQETIRHNLLEEVHPIFHRERHVIHHQTRIQPILEQVLLPPKHYVLIDGQKHEITGDAIMNHVVKQRDFIPMSGHAPKVTVHQFVDHEPLVGPLTGVGASLINKDVLLEHQRLINQSYEHKAAGRTHDIPTGQITTVNYMPGQIPVSNVPGTGSSTLAQSSVEGLSSGHSRTASAAHNNISGLHNSSTTTGHARLDPDEAVERSAGRLQDQRATLN